MKKKLLGLLATLLLQSPVFANLTEVTVLTKGNLTVYLYGDTHLEAYTRNELTDLGVAQNRNRPLQLLKRGWLYVVAGSLGLQNWVASDEISCRITGLAGRGEDITVMLEHYPQLPQSIVNGLKALSNTRRPNYAYSRLCPSCADSVHRKAKEKTKVVVSKFTNNRGLFERINDRLPQAVSTICVDTRRQKIDVIANYIWLLELLSEFELVGFDTSALEQEIGDTMGETSLRDLGIYDSPLPSSVGRYPLYPYIVSVLGEHRKLKEAYCTDNEFMLDEDRWCLALRQLLCQRLLAPYYYFEHEARENILAQENSQTPKVS